MKIDGRGFTLVESLVVLLLTLFLLHLAWRVALAQRVALESTIRRQEVLAAERTVWWVLSEELGVGRVGADWAVVEPDVVAVRAFRGRGMPCRPGPDAEGWVAVRYRGWRAPDPTKDSVAVLDDDGSWGALDLIGRSTRDPGCPAEPGTRAEWWRVTPGVIENGALVLRVFERGSYHLEDAAFRYRRGLGGRQPLTEEVLGDSTGLDGYAHGVRIRFDPVDSLDAGPPISDGGWLRSIRSR